MIRNTKDIKKIQKIKYNINYFCKNINYFNIKIN